MRQGGDHLRRGIALLKAIVADHPGSPLATHSQVALGLSLSRDYADYTVGRLRPAECWSTLHHLEGARADRLPAGVASSPKSSILNSGRMVREQEERLREKTAARSRS